MATPLALTSTEPRSNLHRRDSQASLASESDFNKAKEKPKPKEPKVVNWVTKGKGKVRDAKAVFTETRCLRRTIEQKQKNPDTQKHLDYTSLAYSYGSRAQNPNPLNPINPKAFKPSWWAGVVFCYRSQDSYILMQFKFEV